MEFISDFIDLIFFISLVSLNFAQAIIICFLLKKSSQHEAILFMHQKVLDKLYPDIINNLEQILKS